MPIKLPKGFPRRKSSGNVLDEVQAGGETTSSFKVLARPNSTGKSLDVGNTVRSMTSKPLPAPKASFEGDNEDLFSVVRNDAANRGSGGTSNSLSTAQYDSATSSSRLSSSSTNPSSVDTRSDKNVKTVGQRSYDDIPVPPPHNPRAGFLKNAGRTFSFGINRNHSREANDLPPIPSDRGRPPTNATARDRAMTISSVTTATAPRLDDHTFSLKEADDDFGDMFANLGRKPSRENLTSSMRPAPLRSAARAAPPQPINVNNGGHVESSPYSLNSQNSRDGLIRSPSPSRTVTQSSFPPSTLRNLQTQAGRGEASLDDNLFEDTPVQGSPAGSASKAQLSPVSRPPPPPPPSSFPAAAMHRARASSNATASRSPASDNTESEMTAFDPTLLAHAQLANQYQEKQSSPVLEAKLNNKVMTPAEFERYKQQKEDTRRYNKVFGKVDSDDGSGDEYEDEEEDEQARERQAVKQRKKQEAHLAVYRQQMMKVTGDSPNPEQRPGMSASNYHVGNSSQLDLSRMERRMSSMTFDGNRSTLGAPKLPVDDEDEDDDVPLGILAAHGFPNQNRPPTRLGASSSNPNLRNLAQVQGGASVVGGETNRGGLPAFARNLPADPYYGASIVHQAERAPLAMHASPSLTHLPTQPQPSGAATSHPLHPAGLVGVIAGEERARAMRRGSPNPQGGYDMPPMAPPQQRPPQPMPGYPGMPMVPQQMLSPGEQAQMQMSQSMAQMMQMQMKWMQQMTSMMGQQPNIQTMPGMPMPGMPQMSPEASPMMQMQNGLPVHRPQSVPLQGYHGPGQRTMSTLIPSMANWTHSSPAVPQIQQNGSVYAQSIAPSERSNVGLAPRYRPVSTMTQETDNWQRRASTFTSFTSRPWQNENASSKLGTTTIRNVHPGDDDDDEQGWAEMKARKEKKQKSWKLRRGGSNTLQELYNAPA